MKPIEIHIEGYKIVISKDEGKQDDAQQIKDDMTLPVTYPQYPPTVYPSGWWERPFATWTNADVFNIDVTSATPVRDFMVHGGDMQEKL